VTPGGLASRLAAYAWASPNTLIGLVLGLAVLPFGGKVRIVRGVAEFAAGVPLRVRFDAITFGHAIIGVSEAKLAAARDHEHVHVRQYEIWGPFFLLAYATSSIWQLLRGRSMYYDNHFERQARQA
jgi:hypothetical protein